MSHRLDTDWTPIRIACALACCILLSGASEVFAQAKPQPRTPPPPPPRSRSIEINGYAGFGRIDFTAADTFDVALGSPVGSLLGGGARVGLPLGGLFVDLGMWRFHQNGVRAVVFNGEEFLLGIPLHVTIMPLELSAGWRFRLARAPNLRPYVAGGIASYGYRETSSFATDAENVDERFNGYLLAGGAEFRVERWLGVGWEVNWTSVPNAIGEAGLAAEFDETDLGGTSFRFKITIGQ